MKTIKVKVRMEVIETWEYEVKVDDGFPSSSKQEEDVMRRFEHLSELSDKVQEIDGTLVDSTTQEMDVMSWSLP